MLLNPYNPDTDSDGQRMQKIKIQDLKAKKLQNQYFTVRWKVTTILIKVIIK
jgi:hypothetical protein